MLRLDIFSISLSYPVSGNQSQICRASQVESSRLDFDIFKLTGSSLPICISAALCTEIPQYRRPISQGLMSTEVFHLRSASLLVLL